MEYNITTIIQAVFALIAAVITVIVIPYIKSKTTAQQQTDIEGWVRVAVSAAEQLYKGSGRGDETKAFVLDWLKKLHIAVDEAKLDAMSVGGLLGLWFQSLFVGLTMKALSICIMLVVYGRMIEIYLVTSIAPIPVATMVNREWGGMGQNYLKSLLALGFQAFLILVCVGIYAVLIQTIAATDDISGAIWSCMGYTVLLCFTLFKTGSLAKSVFSAH